MDTNVHVRPFCIFATRSRLTSSEQVRDPQVATCVYVCARACEREAPYRGSSPRSPLRKAPRTAQLVQLRREGRTPSRPPPYPNLWCCSLSPGSVPYPPPPPRPSNCPRRVPAMRCSRRCSAADSVNSCGRRAAAFKPGTCLRCTRCSLTPPFPPFYSFCSSVCHHTVLFLLLTGRGEREIIMK